MIDRKCKYAEEHAVYNTTKGRLVAERQYFCSGTKELDICPCKDGIKNEKCYYWKEGNSIMSANIECKDCVYFCPLGSSGGKCDKYNILQISPSFYCAGAELIEKTHCSMCHSDNPTGSRFCNNCGRRLQ